VHDGGAYDPGSKPKVRENLSKMLVSELPGVRRARAVSREQVARLDLVPEHGVSLLLPLKLEESDAERLSQLEAEPQDDARGLDERLLVKTTDVPLRQCDLLVLLLPEVESQRKLVQVLGAQVLRPHGGVLESTAELGDVVEALPRLMENAVTAVQVVVERHVVDEGWKPRLTVGVHVYEVPKEGTRENEEDCTFG
jgi:hypothetical protein